MHEVLLGGKGKSPLHIDEMHVDETNILKNNVSKEYKIPKIKLYKNKAGIKITIIYWYQR